MNSKLSRLILSLFKIILFLLIFIYAISPIVFKYSTTLKKTLVYMNFMKNSNDSFLSQPDRFSLKCTRTFRINNTVDNVELGAWHILPQSKLNLCTTNELTNRTSIDDSIAFDDDRPIVLYIHGNGGSRGGQQRIELYLRLAYELDYHIITFDYRSFGDSSPVTPSANGLTSDAKTVFDWLMSQDKVTKNRIRVWGHSLGTAITMRLMSALKPDEQPYRIVLEAPFDSIANAVRHHPFGKAYRFLPIFEYFFIKPLTDSPEFNLDSSAEMKHISPNTKILILHAEDDAILPIVLGESLYKEAVLTLGSDNIKFFRIDAKHKVGHKFISRHNDSIKEVKRFFD